jgi:four helix bundle protein
MAKAARRVHILISMHSEFGYGPVERLVAWQRSMDLVVEVYRLADRLPAWERFALADQLRRAASSIPANIAEGNARAHRREYLHFLSIARGSLAEVATHCEAARRVGYIGETDLVKTTDLIRRVRQLLTRLMARLST